MGQNFPSKFDVDAFVVAVNAISELFITLTGVSL